MVLASAVCALLLAAGPVVAQDKKGKMPERTQKVLIDNDTFRVTETTYPPGAGTASTQPGHRVTRALKGGTLERTYADGKKESVTYKQGEVKEVPAATAPYAVRNTGKSEVVLYSVAVKTKK